MAERIPLHLFNGYGVELEYMIVDKATLDVRPLADRAIAAVHGSIVNETALGEIAWSNELVLHVIELKTNGPVGALTGVADLFQSNIQKVNAVLEPLGACLLPSAMHPWMDPHRETVLWPHGDRIIYETYNRIFDCQGHGWANLQSTHLNLAFHGDDEFGRLHAAIRLILPLLPALAASSPLKEGLLTGLADTRLDCYRFNQKRIPSITGRIVPEQAFSREQYNEQILQRVAADIKPHDQQNILEAEWLNSRGAIARFERGAIEIRVLDIQECPQADLAIIQIAIELLRALVLERWSAYAEQQEAPTEALAELFLRSMKTGLETKISDAAYLAHFGLGNTPMTMRELWAHVASLVLQETDFNRTAIDLILEKGNLSDRIKTALGTKPSRTTIRDVYRDLTNCLAQGSLFH